MYKFLNVHTIFVEINETLDILGQFECREFINNFLNTPHYIDNLQSCIVGP